MLDMNSYNLIQLHLMRYDFRKIQEAIQISGKTLRDVEDMTGLDYSTVSRAMKTGRAHQSTAVALTKAFRVSMKAIQVKRSRVA